MNEIKFLEVKNNDLEMMNAIIKLEEEAFGVNGAVDSWILKPLMRYGKVLILKKSDQIIGVVELMNSWLSKEVYIYGLAIAKDLRGLGYGKILLNETLEYLEKNGINEVSLTVDPLNIKAINLYERLGFINKGIKRDEYGKNVDRILMIKNLSYI